MPIKNNSLMPSDVRRIDTLLALAHLFSETESVAGDGTESGVRVEPRRLLQGLSKADRDACDARLAWHGALPAVEQARWLRHTLSRIGDNRHPQLDAQIDASHVLAVLRREPPRVQKLICAHLAPPLAEALAAQLSIASVTATHEPSSAVMNVVRDAFLRKFVSLRDLNAPTQLDALSRAELARTLRLLGVRETAFACRSIPAVETVAAFVRRFEPADARAILAHITMLTDALPARISFAERSLARMIEHEEDSTALLDRTGLYVLAAALAARDDVSARYTEQKLPLEGALELQALIDECRQSMSPEILRERGAEVEAMAAEVRRAINYSNTYAPVISVDGSAATGEDMFGDETLDLKNS